MSILQINQIERFAETDDAADNDAMPVDLHKLLFSDTAISQKSGNVFAVLDAAKITNLPELLETSNLQFKCLFQGKSLEELGNVAPWIVQLKTDDIFTRNLFTQSDAPWHIWNPNIGIYLTTNASLTQTTAHLRRFTRVITDDGQRRYMRFWEPALFGEYFRIVAALEGSLPFFQDSELSFHYYFPDDRDGCVRVSAKQRTDRAVEPFRLHTKVLTNIAAHHQISQTCTAYQIPYNRSAYDTVSLDTYDHHDLAIISLMQAHFGLDVRRYDPSVYPKDTARQKKIALLNQLVFFKTQGVAIGM